MVTMIDRGCSNAPLPPFSPHVLVVDDHDDSRHLYAHFLAHIGGCQVTEAAKGGEALALLQRDPPDAVVLDLVLPEVDGFEICRTVRETPALANTKVIVVSGLTPLTDDQRKRLQAARPDAHLLKPCHPEVVLTQLRALLAHGRTFRDQAVVERARAARLQRRAHDLQRRSADLQAGARKLLGGD